MFVEEVFYSPGERKAAEVLVDDRNLRRQIDFRICGQRYARRGKLGKVQIRALPDVVDGRAQIESAGMPVGQRHGSGMRGPPEQRVAWALATAVSGIYFSDVWSNDRVARPPPGAGSRGDRQLGS